MWGDSEGAILVYREWWSDIWAETWRNWGPILGVFEGRAFESEGTETQRLKGRSRGK